MPLKRTAAAGRPGETGDSRPQSTAASRRQTRLLCLLLGAVTLLLYAPVGGHSYIDYDDFDYVVDNPHVATGLSAANLAWAFRTAHSANWHPLTWLSHGLDCQLFGLNPGPQHLVNALLHAVNTALLFLALARMTSRTWRSAVVAALFGWHPLHVESVAWIAERKDVLSTLFGFLAIPAYKAYTRQKNWRRYSLVALCLALGLMAKPMLVTLPCVLLLLDYWPLRRFQPSAAAPPLRAAGRLLAEKIPLFALSAAACLVTFLTQRAAGAVVSGDSLPLLPRLENGALSYFRYLGKMFWPDGLMLPYMFGIDFNHAVVLLAAAALLAITLLAVRFGGRFGYLPVGWFWYLGTLAPVIGVVQVGIQSMADRYTYVPLVGVFIMVVWGAGDLLSAWGAPRRAAGTLGALVLGACLILTSRQLQFWKNSETLFFHSITVQPYNLPAMDCLAWTYATDPDPRLRNGDRALRLATACVRDTDRAMPDFLMTLSAAYAETGRFELAIETAEEALRLPHVAEVPEFAAKARARIELYKSDRAIHSNPGTPGKGG